jgi:hypothetical protein
MGSRKNATIPESNDDPYYYWNPTTNQYHYRSTGQPYNANTHQSYNYYNQTTGSATQQNGYNQNSNEYAEMWKAYLNQQRQYQNSNCSKEENVEREEEKNGVIITEVSDNDDNEEGQNKNYKTDESDDEKYNLNKKKDYVDAISLNEDEDEDVTSILQMEKLSTVESDLEKLAKQVKN